MMDAITDAITLLTIGVAVNSLSIVLLTLRLWLDTRSHIRAIQADFDRLRRLVDLNEGQDREQP